jgi:hypothetical protein
MSVVSEEREVEEVTKTASKGEDITLLTVVKSKDPEGKPWKEVGDVLSYTAGGAGFFVERECKVGCLVSLMLALPVYLRCYDHEKELYRVWGLVQFCQPMKDGDREGFHVGVAFIGKRAPESYHENPDQSYRIRGMDEDGLWRIEEAKTAFKTRRHLRYWTEVDLYLALIDGNRDSISGERTITENISKSGAAVFTTLDVGVGDRVKFISERFDFSGLAVVCNKQSGKDKKTRLHLNFVENQFPIDRLKIRR